MVVCDLEELGKVIPDGVIVGQHGLHAHIHNGHLHLIQAARKRCQFTIGMYYANFAQLIEAFCGKTVKYDTGPLLMDVTLLESLHDVVMIWQRNYIPFEPGLWERCAAEYPDSRLAELGLLESEAQVQSFRTSQAIVHTLNRVIRYDFNFTGWKDAWRVPFFEWYDKTYPGKSIRVEPLRDRFGNCISGGTESLPEREKIKIDRRLLLPSFRAKADVVRHCADIEGLKVISFHNMVDVTGTVHARFGLAGHQWNDGCFVESEGF